MIETADKPTLVSYVGVQHAAPIFFIESEANSLCDFSGMDFLVDSVCFYC